MPRGRADFATASSSFALFSMVRHWASLNQSNPAGGDPQTRTKLLVNRVNLSSGRTRSSPANLDGLILIDFQDDTN